MAGGEHVSTSGARSGGRNGRVFAAFAIVYLVWGSTYLAIRIGVHEAPPVLFAGLRFLIAGPLLLAYAGSRGLHLPRSVRDWRWIIITALLMLVGANGLVTYCEQWVASNQTALMVATSALWMAGFGAIGTQGERPNALSILGLLLGFAGVAVLVGRGLTQNAAPWHAYALLMLSPVLWAAGSILSRRYPLEVAPLMSAALQMCVTGLLMTAGGLVLGEHLRWRWTPGVTLSLFYLAIFGSCIAYAAYFWLVHAVTPAQLGTYAYVNPAIAVLLGAWWLDETLDALQGFGTGVILAGVITVTLAQRAARPR